jgi:hypothetical protein
MIDHDDLGKSLGYSDSAIIRIADRTFILSMLDEAALDEFDARVQEMAEVVGREQFFAPVAWLLWRSISSEKLNEVAADASGFAEIEAELRKLPDGGVLLCMFQALDYSKRIAREMAHAAEVAARSGVN